MSKKITAKPAAKAAKPAKPGKGKQHPAIKGVRSTDHKTVEVAPMPAAPAPVLMTVRLAQLVSGDGDRRFPSINARKTPLTPGSVAEMMASIAFKGIIQPLAVRPVGEPGEALYQVEAGNRRLVALRALRADGRIGDDYAVPVAAREENAAEAFETSVAENVVREHMHPVDEMEAFARMLGDGKGVGEIARRFGVGERHVEQRLALGTLAKDVRAAWREGVITLEIAKAFAGTPDEERQLTVLAAFKKAQSWERSEHFVRNRIRDAAIRTTDARVKSVGLKAYRDAGGRVHQDLFEDGSYLLDLAILERLEADKLAAEKTRLLAEGWGWVATEPELGAAMWSMPQLDPALPAEDEARLAAIDEALEAIDAGPEGESEEAEAALTARYQALEEERDALDKKRATAGFTPEQKAMAGVVLDRTGAVRRRAVVRPEDAPQPERRAGARILDNGRAAPDAPEQAGLSQALSQELSEILTGAAIDAALGKHDATLAILAATLVWQASAEYRSEASPMRVKLSPWSPSATRERNPAYEAARAAVSFAEVAKESFAATLAAILPLPREAIVTLIAQASALAIDLSEAQYYSPDRPATRAEDRAAVRDALSPDVAQHWQPLAENYFGKIAKASIADAIAEACDPQQAALAAAKKKGDMAALAERIVTATGWLPAQLRTPSYAGPRAAPEAAAPVEAEDDDGDYSHIAGDADTGHGGDDRELHGDDEPELPEDAHDAELAVPAFLKPKGRGRPALAVVA